MWPVEPEEVPAAPRQSGQRLAAGSSILELTRDLAQITHRDAEGDGDALDGSPGGVGVAALYQGEGAGRDVGGVGEVFLGCAAFFAQLADRFPEGGLGLVRSAHLLGRFQA